ncbi:Sec-independent protein translocase protein TatB [Phenylobacterium sp.]|uniref:Sec-independent protein translocase protein TatB n=1 Tax=Phenylobacterium sp. TaxID=1871053 RepID=UPI003982E628
MLDIGISEIAVILVVALVVIGPERLPRVARTIGTLMGRAQRYVSDVKAEVNREMELEELRKLQTQMQDAARGFKEQVSTAGAEMQSAVSDVEKQLNEGIVTPPVAPPPPEPYIPTPLEEPPPLEPAAKLPAPDFPAQVGAPAPDHSAPGAPAPHRSAHPDASAPDKPAQTSLFPEHTVR